MKSDAQKIEELMKLKQLAPYPIEASFITGYLTYGVTIEQSASVKDLVEQVIVLIYEQIISSQNMLQLLVVIKADLLSQKGREIKSLSSLAESYISELALDNSYLSRKYFQKEMKKEDIIPESMGFDCPICTMDIMSHDLVLLGCGHMFHNQCLGQYSKEKIVNKIIPFKCPSEGCSVDITSDEVNQFLPKELKQKYEDFSFHNYVEKHMKDTSWCPTPGCSAVFSFDAALTDYRCPACKKHYCLACRCEFHTNLTCAEYKEMQSLDDDDKKFMFLAKGSKYKQCPNCKFWVQKTQGCDHMTCRCKYQFCYICGGKYNHCKCQGFEDQGGQEQHISEHQSESEEEKEKKQAVISQIQRPKIFSLPRDLSSNIASYASENADRSNFVRPHRIREQQRPEQVRLLVQNEQKKFIEAKEIGRVEAEEMMKKKQILEKLKEQKMEGERKKMLFGERQRRILQERKQRQIQQYNEMVKKNKQEQQLQQKKQKQRIEEERKKAARVKLEAESEMLRIKLQETRQRVEKRIKERSSILPEKSEMSFKPIDRTFSKVEQNKQETNPILLRVEEKPAQSSIEQMLRSYEESNDKSSHIRLVLDN